MIAYLRKGKGHNQRGNENDVTFTFVHFVQLSYGTPAL